MSENKPLSREKPQSKLIDIMLPDGTVLKNIARVPWEIDKGGGRIAKIELDDQMELNGVTYQYYGIYIEDVAEPYPVIIPVQKPQDEKDTKEGEPLFTELRAPLTVKGSETIRIIDLEKELESWREFYVKRGINWVELPERIAVTQEMKREMELVMSTYGLGRVMIIPQNLVKGMAERYGYEIGAMVRYPAEKYEELMELLKLPREQYRFDPDFIKSGGWQSITGAPETCTLVLYDDSAEFDQNVIQKATKGVSLKSIEKDLTPPGMGYMQLYEYMLFRLLKYKETGETADREGVITFPESQLFEGSFVYVDKTFAAGVNELTFFAIRRGELDLRPMPAMGVRFAARFVPEVLEKVSSESVSLEAGGIPSRIVIPARSSPDTTLVRVQLFAKCTTAVLDMFSKIAYPLPEKTVEIVAIPAGKLANDTRIGNLLLTALIKGYEPAPIDVAAEIVFTMKGKGLTAKAMFPQAINQQGFFKMPTLQQLEVGMKLDIATLGLDGAVPPDTILVFQKKVGDNKQ